MSGFLTTINVENLHVQLASKNLFKNNDVLTFCSQRHYNCVLATCIMESTHMKAQEAAMFEKKRNIGFHECNAVRFLLTELDKILCCFEFTCNLMTNLATACSLLSHDRDAGL